MAYLPFVSADRQQVLGHYRVGQRSGVIATTLVALSPLASFRWAPTQTNVFAVLLRVQTAWASHTTLTANDVEDVSGTIARGFTVDFSANNTQANLTAQTGMQRSNMGKSLMGSKGPQIGTTLGMTGQTYTLDADHHCVLPYNVTSTTVGLCDRVNLVDRTVDGEHPPCLAVNEGYIVRNFTAWFTSGTSYFYCNWLWAEVLVF